MASKNIKGITIEIGGNTTKLSEALKNVDKNVYSLNSDLKALNQALKLDPKNTELLAQKQDVLRRNIQETKNRVDTLKEALRQMGDYNRLTDEQKQSYNQLSLEIAKSEKALKGMNEELKNTNKVDFSKVKISLEKVGEIAANVSKKMLQVTTAITGALTGLVTAGIKSYANLEQNIGGIQKIFGDSANELIKNSQEAYKTAGISANQYMETATSFSASLIKGLGGDTQKAAQLTDRAIRDMSDNANTFGSSMDEVMNVYKALSKEQYTTLDNLRLGYSGTKEGVKKLVKDASEYANAHKELGINVDANSLSFDNLINAISVTQKKMRIAGTTAKEAEGTITGSISSMKAAFDNFLNGSGSPDALGDAISNVLINFGKAFQKLAPNIIKGLNKTIKKVTPILLDIFWEILPNLIDLVDDFINTLFDYIAGHTKYIQETVTMIITEIVLFFTKNLPKFIEIGLKLIVTLAKGIIEALPKLIPSLINCIKTITETLLDNIPLIIEVSIQLIMTLIDGLIEALPTLIEFLPTIIEKTIEALINALPMLIMIGPKLILKIIEAVIKALPSILMLGPEIIMGIIKGITNSLTNLATSAGDIVNTIKNVLTKLPGQALQWGKDMLNGFINGMKAKLKSIGDTAKSIGKKIKSFLHFSRPDEGPLRDYETWMPDFVEGLANGIKKSRYLIEDASMDLANDIKQGLFANTSMALKSLNGSIETSLNPTINPSVAYDLNYQLMAQAMKEAMQDMGIYLDERKLGAFVDKTVSEEVFN